MILGLHCSIRNGYLAALREATDHGCSAMQMFSYRRHHDPGSDELREFCRAREDSGVRSLLVHVRYLPFLASVGDERHQHSIRLLSQEIKLAKALGARGLVAHAGAYSIGDDARRGLVRFADGVRAAWDDSDGGFEIVLENVPGGGRRMGGTLEELSELGELLSQRDIPVGYCLDTAHAWAQGYEIASAEGMWRFIGKGNRLLGAERIKAFHLNDTRALLGSHREHHWHWGQGHLGTEGLKFLLERPEYAGALGILETPKDLDLENLALVRRLTTNAV